MAIDELYHNSMLHKKNWNLYLKKEHYKFVILWIKLAFVDVLSDQCHKENTLEEELLTSELTTLAVLLKETRELEELANYSGTSTSKISTSKSASSAMNVIIIVLLRLIVVVESVSCEIIMNLLLDLIGVITTYNICLHAFTHGRQQLKTEREILLHPRNIFTAYSLCHLIFNRLNSPTIAAHNELLQIMSSNGSENLLLL
ncbi:uncharacterized protein G2W53_016205 [Senna tora]|uniref:Uncharacterized protein n=1 Tax=Senna tora TaxID=362788 RepID=A0A834TQ31_9FABA|nr:uncharacterized protein G2W53_016205 [Senna tora]